MLKQRLIHPEILDALASAGHGSKILVADGNFPCSTRIGENADLVFLNLAPGKPTVTEVLDVLRTAVPIEDAAVMMPDEGPEPAIFEEFRKCLPDLSLTLFDRYRFYDEVEEPDTCLVIMTGEQRIYANILLTIGVVMP